MKRMDKSYFGLRLHLVLDKHNMSQKEFADLVNVTEMTASKWVNGQSQPRIDYLVVICRRLGVSADWLLGLKEKRR